MGIDFEKRNPSSPVINPAISNRSGVRSDLSRGDKESTKRLADSERIGYGDQMCRDRPCL